MPVLWWQRLLVCPLSLSMAVASFSGNLFLICPSQLPTQSLACRLLGLAFYSRRTDIQFWVKTPLVQMGLCKKDKLICEQPRQGIPFNQFLWEGPGLLSFCPSPPHHPVASVSLKCHCLSQPGIAIVPILILRGDGHHRNSPTVAFTVSRHLRKPTIDTLQRGQGEGGVMGREETG